MSDYTPKEKIVLIDFIFSKLEKYLYTNIILSKVKFFKIKDE
tara:strand:- start:138 stop:263 length:126 start_codon:yes stop_codon:yes gene_type:complete